MDLRLDDKRALVTGSTRGIGYAIAEGLAQEGAEVTINGRSAERVAEATEALSTRQALRQLASPPILDQLKAPRSFLRKLVKSTFSSTMSASLRLFPLSTSRMKRGRRSSTSM